MRVWIFELYTLIGAMIYTTLMIVLGWTFAENFDRALSIARGLTWFGFVVLVAMIVFLVWGRKKYIERKVVRLVSEAEAEEIGEGDEPVGEDRPDDADA
jgi:membrane protein DedA with SNARE-associated domain